MRRRTVGRLMVWMVPLAVALGLGRPAVSILVTGGSHSHPPAQVDPKPLPPGWCPLGRMQLSTRGHVIHPDPFWTQYFRLLAGSPWPGDYVCPLVPAGTAEERP